MGGVRKNTQVAYVTPLPKRRKEAKCVGKKTRENRIKDERKRLAKVFENLQEDAKGLAEGLIDNMAYMRIELEDIRDDINKNGRVEMFRQGDQEPYERIRPVANDYNNLISKYTNAFKEVSRRLPDKAPVEQETDGFEDFVSGRDEV